MEFVKAKADFFQPDPCSLGTGPALDQQYELLSYFELHQGVPEQIRSYMASVVTLWLYGWLYYPFYAHVVFLSTTVVEMALRERLPKQLDKTGRDRRGLSNLLRAATKAGLLREEGFPSLKHRSAGASLGDAAVVQDKGHSQSQEPSYVDVLGTWLPKIRNSFAHPKMHAILMPGQVVDSLILTAEIVNQLWAAPAPDA